MPSAGARVLRAEARSACRDTLQALDGFGDAVRHEDRNNQSHQKSQPDAFLFAIAERRMRGANRKNQDDLRCRSNRAGRCGASSSFLTIRKRTEVLAAQIKYYGGLESCRLPCHWCLQAGWQ